MEHKNTMRILLFLVAVALVFQQCATRVSKTKTAETYTEDVSLLRPEFTEEHEMVVEESDVAVVLEKAPYTAPRYDVTDALDAALEKNAEINRSRPYTVFTVQVYNGPSRMRANEIRRQVYGVMPEVEPVLEYRQPNYKVKVGTFGSRADAHKTFKKLQQNFPGTVLVPERVIPEVDGDR
jgi:hypothetical protein